MNDLVDKIHRHNDGFGTLSFESIQDCTNIAEACKTQQLQGITGTGDIKLAARIPDVFVIKYCNDNNITFNEFLTNREHIKRLGNDPAIAHFRVWKGRL